MSPTRTTRREEDPLGAVDVPAEALYGVQTVRAVQNFPVSGLAPDPGFVDAVVRIKRAAASVHKGTGRLDRALADAIIGAADEVLGGRHRDQFVVDPFQAGAGTSMNMNVNEVLANLANRGYQSFGFEPSPMREQQWLLLLKDARKLMSLASGS